MPTRRTRIGRRTRSRNIYNWELRIRNQELDIMNWLFKEEPTHYSFDALVKDKKAVWSGVKNPLAQKHLHAVKRGDRIFYYHTGDELSLIHISEPTRLLSISYAV